VATGPGEVTIRAAPLQRQLAAGQLGLCFALGAVVFVALEIEKIWRRQ
jgi:hypothetical protein